MALNWERRAAGDLVRLARRVGLITLRQRCGAAISHQAQLDALRAQVTAPAAEVAD